MSGGNRVSERVTTISVTS